MSQPSDFSQPHRPFDAAPPPPQQGMSGGAKLMIGLGIGCAVVLVLCCGGAALMGYFFARGFQPSEDPTEVRDVAANIVTIDVPPALEPKVSINFTVPVFNQKMMLAVFGDKDDHSMLMLMQFSPEFGTPDSMKGKMQDAMSQSGHKNQGWNEVPLEDAKEFKAEINGKEATFKYGKGKGEKGEVWQATGVFEGKSGTGMLITQLNAESFTEEQLVEILKSLK